MMPLFDAWLMGALLSVTFGIVVGGISRLEESKGGARVALAMILLVPIWPVVPVLLLGLHCRRLSQIADIKLPRLIRSGQVDHRTSGHLSEVDP